MFAYLRSHRIVFGVGIVVGLLLVAWLFLPDRGVSDEDTESVVPQVELLDLGSVGTGGKLELVGEVRSQAEAILRIERGGEVTEVYVSSGDRVAPGTVLAEVENASERAAIAQARASLQTQEANLAKALAGARPEERVTLEANVASAEVALTEAEVGVVNRVRSAYTSVEAAVRNDADTFFEEPRTNPDLIPIAGTYTARVALEARRKELESLLVNWSAEVSALSAEGDLEQALSTAETNTRAVKSFLDELAFIVSDQEPRADLTASQISSQNTTLQGARASMDSTLTALSGARTTLASARAQLESAESAEAQGVTGARSEDVDAARAAVASAEAGVQSAFANYDKTVLRSPIAGVVTTLALSRGDFANSGELGAVVANPQALQVELFVSAATRNRLSVGETVRIADVADGVITSLDPGINPATNQARVFVGVTEGASGLVQGDTVTLVRDATDAPQAPEVQTNGPVEIPLTALKIRPTGKSVFTVDDGVLIAHPVEDGAIIGDAIQIVSGITRDMRIVRDVRGLNDGDAVTVAGAEYPTPEPSATTTVAF